VEGEAVTTPADVFREQHPEALALYQTNDLLHDIRDLLFVIAMDASGSSLVLNRVREKMRAEGFSD
jgi:hypothetical protein